MAIDQGGAGSKPQPKPKLVYAPPKLAKPTMQAVKLWNTAVGGNHFEFTPDVKAADIMIHSGFPADTPKNAAGTAVISGHTVWVTKGFTPDSKSMVSTLTHELGHIVGLDHAVGGQPGVMEPVLDTTQPITPGEAADARGKIGAGPGYENVPPEAVVRQQIPDIVEGFRSPGPFFERFWQENGGPGNHRSPVLTANALLGHTWLSRGLPENYSFEDYSADVTRIASSFELPARNRK